MTKSKETQPISWSTISILIITIRILLANTTPILDCDEVYNYWEGVYSLLNNGTNYIQTWEYTPQYALRTYVYLYPMYYYARVLQLASQNKVMIFSCLRCIQAGITGYCEVSYAQSFNDTMMGYIYLMLSITSSGMYHSSVSYLPSSTAMQLYILSQSYLNTNEYYKCIVLGIISVLCTGWPFCIILYIPCGLYISYTYRIRAIAFAVVVTITLQAIITSIDTYHYNTLKLATWNIIKYNIQGGGDELYGIEPLSYYIKNLLLNFNYCSIAILLTPILLSFQRKFGLLYKLSPMYLWIAITFTRKHKEERFLYPIYPIIIHSSAIIMHEIGNIFKSKRKQIVSLMILPYIILSTSRNIALSTYYMAPIYIFSYFYNHALSKQSDTTPSVLCTAGEWYRYPSSFFLPNNIQLQFLESSFKGQLPKPIYSNIDKISNFNDLNKEERSRYVEIQSCDYVIDLRFDDGNDDKNKLMLDNDDGDWKEIVSFPFLDMERTNVLYRSLYLPEFVSRFVLRGGGRKFANYVLYERRR